ncbi:MAG: hypothetical protein H0Z32_10905 [Bacillaceae bacterium]|nr:hypothetical protein [Bacillaceae bacterium]
MKKMLISSISVLLFIVAVYSYVWFETYQKSNIFFEQANNSFQEKDYGLALKGGEIYSEEKQDYVTIGGYEDVLNAWSSQWAIPKPSIYKEAKQKINKIIYEKLSPSDGIAIFQEYFRLDNDHLPEILLQTGKLYKAQGETEKAIEIFELVIKAFGMNESAKRKAENQLNELKSLTGK